MSPSIHAVFIRGTIPYMDVPPYTRRVYTGAQPIYGCPPVYTPCVYGGLSHIWCPHVYSSTRRVYTGPVTIEVQCLEVEARPFEKGHRPSRLRQRIQNIHPCSFNHAMEVTCSRVLWSVESVYSPPTHEIVSVPACRCPSETAVLSIR